MPFLSISAAVTAVIAIGTVCRLSERRCAVTVTSSSTLLSVELVSAASSGAAAEIKQNNMPIALITPPYIRSAPGESTEAVAGSAIHSCVDARKLVRLRDKSREGLKVRRRPGVTEWGPSLLTLPLFAPSTVLWMCNGSGASARQRRTDDGTFRSGANQACQGGPISHA